jgi:hypothetical protein
MTSQEFTSPCVTPIDSQLYIHDSDGESTLSLPISVAPLRVGVLEHFSSIKETDDISTFPVFSNTKL